MDILAPCLAATSTQDSSHSSPTKSGCSSLPKPDPPGALAPMLPKIRPFQPPRWSPTCAGMSLRTRAGLTQTFWEGSCVELSKKCAQLALLGAPASLRATANASLRATSQNSHTPHTLTHHLGPLQTHHLGPPMLLLLQNSNESEWWAGCRGGKRSFYPWYYFIMT